MECGPSYEKGQTLRSVVSLGLPFRRRHTPAALVLTVGHNRPVTEARTTQLSPTALALRTLHAAITLVMLAAIAHIWRCAITGRRDAALNVATAAIAVESTLIVANGGDCPLGPSQERAGDPVPLFELVLSPHAAKAAVPALGAIAITGIALVVRRGWTESNVATGAPKRKRPHEAAVFW